jgi:GT2 family glycosyltransferase
VGARAPRRARVAAVVLNYQTPQMALDCVETVVAALDPELDCAVVVDNASNDGSAEQLRRAIDAKGWPAVRLVESDRNGGFSAGNNVGIRAVEAQAYLLLNSDTLVEPDAVDLLWGALQADARIGLVSPRLQYRDGTPQISCFRLHTPLSELIAGSGTGLVRRFLARWDVPIDLSEQAFEPGWTSFAAVMLRRDVVDAIGGLDEGYFMYYEDTDYCRRARQAGWRLWHEPRARVVHLRGGSSPVKRFTAERRRRPRYYYASRARYFRRAFGPAGLLAANLGWTLGRGIAWLREQLGSKQPHTVEAELMDVWRG